MQNEQVSIARGWAAVEEARRARGGFGRGGGVRESGSEESVRGLGSRSGGLTARPVGLGGGGRPTVMLGSRGEQWQPSDWIRSLGGLNFDLERILVATPPITCGYEAAKRRQR